MLRIGKLFWGIILLFGAICFIFAPKTYADDPCTPLENPPLLYQINRTPNQATLFFSPIATDQVQSYSIIYGYNSGDERFSITFDQGPTTGAISYTVNDLEPGMQYFYKVRGNTSCLQSPWSTWVGDKAVNSGSSISVSNVPVTGPETIYLWGALPLLMIISGVGLFAFSTRK